MKSPDVPTVAVASSSRLRALRARRSLTAAACSVTVVALASSACVTTTAQTAVERPALEVPPPPPRVITPLPVPASPLPEVIEDPESKPSNPPKPKPQPAAPASAKPEAKPPETPPTDPVAPPTTPPATPPQPTLTTPPPTGDAGAASKQVKDSIDRTRAALAKIDYGPLSNDRKKAYDDSKLFATQAEDALKANNLVFAKELADKAERLAKELQGR